MARRSKPQILKESPSQTAGPYVHIGLVPAFAGIKKVYRQDLGANTKPSGDAITISGRVIDGAGEPVRDCLIEFFQADARGKMAERPIGAKGSRFTGFNRIAVNQTTGEYRLQTVKPGLVPMADGTLQAPHVTIWIVARGINIGLHTRLYFGDEAERNAKDPILKLVPKSRIDTLLADARGKGRYHFDIRLQGENETVFFDA
jgi:protocatechuate 3,4-dioxygenase alpha subunit